METTHPDYDYDLNEAIKALPKDDGPFVDVCRQVVARKTAHMHKDVLVDLFTASLVTQVYDALKPANQEKMRKLHPLQVVDIVYKVAK